MRRLVVVALAVLAALTVAGLAVMLLKPSFAPWPAPVAPPPPQTAPGQWGNVYRPGDPGFEERIKRVNRASRR